MRYELSITLPIHKIPVSVLYEIKHDRDAEKENNSKKRRKSDKPQCFYKIIIDNGSLDSFLFSSGVNIPLLYMTQNQEKQYVFRFGYNDSDSIQSIFHQYIIWACIHLIKKTRFDDSLVQEAKANFSLLTEEDKTLLEKFKVRIYEEELNSRELYAIGDRKWILGEHTIEYLHW